MRIQIVGGGPGGLYFGLLMKRRDPSHEVTVYERDAIDETFGWGVAFSEQAFSYLRDTDEVTYRHFRTQAVVWDHFDVVQRGHRVRAHGTPFAGITRLAFVHLLRGRCADAGVMVRCQTNLHDLRALPDCDLLVGADGAHSLVRRTYADAFQPDLRTGRNKYVWLGVRQRLDGYVLALRSTPAGVFAAHLYPHSDEESTAVVECAETTWTRAGLDVKTDYEACAFLSEVFADELFGHFLISNDRMQWRNFLRITNAHWSHEHVVILGDALHTVHFSTAKGTQLAIEDAIALWHSFEAHTDVSDALREYEASRRPAVELAQQISAQSLSWFEDLEHAVSLAPVALAEEVVRTTRRLEPSALQTLEIAGV